MAEVKKIATRESYGNALKELAAGGADNLVVLDADLPAQPRPAFLRKPIRIATLTAALLRRI